MPHTIPTTIHWHGLSLPCRVDPHWQDAVPAGDPSIDDRPEWDAYHPGVEPTPENIQRIPDANSRKAWHFLCRGGRLRDGSKPPNDGVWLEHNEPVSLCLSGLHASVRPIDALNYATSAIVCRVECGGEIVKGDDKLVCSRRRILWRADATDALRRFARSCALDVVGKWDAPDVVVRYLETGDESIRAVACDAVWEAARAAARAGARAATRAGAWAAARDAAGAATWPRQRAGAWAAARAAALAAGWAAARAAAGAAAEAAARVAQNRRLASMLRALDPAGGGDG